jgi:succinate-acetate transporter protein
MAALLIRGDMYTAFIPRVTLRLNKTPQFVLSLPTILFSLSIIINAIAYGARKTIGEYGGIICGLFVVEATLAHVPNE